MSATAPSFPGGIADREGGTGFVALAGEIVAVELDTGAVVWRRVEAGRPLAVVPAGLVTLRQRGDRIEVGVLDPATGEPVRDIGPMPVPDWAVAEWNRPEAFAATARAHDDGLEITWRAQRQYRGGAAPSAEIERAARADAAGRVRVDPSAGRLEALPAAGGLDTLRETAQQTSEVSAAGPDVMAAARLGDRFYVLKAVPTPGAGTRVILEARRTPTTEQPIWQTVIQEQPAQRPPPLRR